MARKMDNKQLESLMIAYIVDNPKIYYLVNDFFNPEDFFNIKYSNLYKRIIKDLTNNIELNIVVISEFGILKISELVDLTSQIVTRTTNTILNTAKILKEYSLKRQLITLNKIIEKEIKDGADVFETIEKHRLELERLHIIDESTNILGTEQGILLYDTYLNFCKNKNSFAKTGFSDFDKHYGGLIPAEYSIIAARTSIGKTSFALSIANNISKNGQRVAYLTTEMTPFQLLMRIASFNTKIPLMELRQFNLKNDISDKLYDYCESLKDTNIIIQHLKNVNENIVYNKIKMLKEMYDVKVVIVDLADKIKCSEKKGTRLI